MMPCENMFMIILSTWFCWYSVMLVRKWCSFHPLYLQVVLACLSDTDLKPLVCARGTKVCIYYLSPISLCDAHFRILFVTEVAPRNVDCFIFLLIALRVNGSEIHCGSGVADVLLQNALTSPPPLYFFPCLFRSLCQIGRLLSTKSVCPRTHRGQFFLFSQDYTTPPCSGYCFVWVCICSCSECCAFPGIIFV